MPDRENRTLRVLVAENVTLEGLRSVLGDDRLRWAYASRMEDTGLGWLKDLLAGNPLGAPDDGRRPGVALARWDEGRAFGPLLEVDWWRDGESYRLRALLDQGDPPANVAWEDAGEPLAAIGDERAVLLHGLLDEESPADQPTWSEARVPRRLAHPYPGIEEAPQVVLLGQDYGRRGIVALTRLLEVAALAGEEADQG